MLWPSLLSVNYSNLCCLYIITITVIHKHVCIQFLFGLWNMF